MDPSRFPPRPTEETRDGLGPSASEGPQGRRSILLVIGERACTSHALPDTGSITIGRSQENDITIDDTASSRRHAVLHVGPPCRIEDLGSANGTYVREAVLSGDDNESDKTARTTDRRVLPGNDVEIRPGHVVLIGSTRLMLQPGAVMRRPRRLWPHGYFEGQLERECARAERSKSHFAVIRVHVDRGAASEQVEEVLAAATRSVDVVAAYGPSEYEVLLVDADSSHVDKVRKRMLAQFAERSIVASLGIACHPEDGRSPETLIDKACERVGGRDAGELSPPHIVVEDPAMRELYRLAEKVADSTISVLLLGETGVGKEVLAEAIWRRSSRSTKPLLPINCAALSETLLESELFGHERGAFTGATGSKAGLLESADGGTVFMDEVGELPLTIQVKLLRVLEAQEVLRVGGTKPRRIDVRFIAATNRDLEQDVARGTFREDLYYRLNGITLVIPPLRERRADIEPLARSLLQQLCRKAGVAR